MDEEGARFEGRKEAIDQLIKEQRSPEDIFKLWSTLHRDGWEADEEKLPTGWKKKYFPSQGCFHYLSPMMQVCKMNSTASSQKQNFFRWLLGRQPLCRSCCRGRSTPRRRRPGSLPGVWRRRAFDAILVLICYYNHRLL